MKLEKAVEQRIIISYCCVNLLINEIFDRDYMILHKENSSGFVAYA